MTGITHARVGTLGAALLAGALALTGCSASTTDARTDDSSAGLVPAAEGTTSYPFEIETPWGSTTLEERPERIAAVTPSQDDAEILVALGVTPILISDDGPDVWVEEALNGEIEGTYSPGDTQYPVEQILAADPDLIVTLGADISDVYDKLADIAPVLSTATEEASEKTIANEWADSIRAVGEALDLQDAAEQVLVDQEQFYEDFRTEHAEFEGLTATYLVYYGEDGGVQYHSTIDSPAGNVFEGMGFSPNPLAEQFVYREEVSQEMISAVDADVIIFSDNSGGDYATITEQPLFQQLQAVQDGHLIVIDNQSENGKFLIDGVEYQGNLPWALARSGPLSGTWAASQLAPAVDAVLAD